MGQRELARILGISSNQMNRYENGLNNPTAVMLIRLSEELGVSIDYLLGRSDDPLGYRGEDLSQEERKLLEAYSIGDGSTLFRMVYERLQKQEESSAHEG